MKNVEISLTQILDVVVHHPENIDLAGYFVNGLIENSKAFATLPTVAFIPGEANAALERIAKWKQILAGIVSTVVLDTAESPQIDFELYEILQDSSGVHLRRVQ